jgi:hypothetical protein
LRQREQRLRLFALLKFQGPDNIGQGLRVPAGGEMEECQIVQRCGKIRLELYRPLQMFGCGIAFSTFPQRVAEVAVCFGKIRVDR